MNERSRSFEDLVWNREGDVSELAIEARIPAAKQQLVNRDGKHLCSVWSATRRSPCPLIYLT